MFRRVITTVMYGDGSSRSTAQDFLFDKSLDAWFEKTGPFDYYGPGVAPVGERGFGHENGRGDTPVGERALGGGRGREGGLHPLSRSWKGELGLARRR